MSFENKFIMIVYNNQAKLLKWKVEPLKINAVIIRSRKFCEKNDIRVNITNRINNINKDANLGSGDLSINSYKKSDKKMKTRCSVKVIRATP